MATNQTTNYQLNQWEPTDQVQRTDFNADNAKIDAALAVLGHAQVLDTVTLAQANNSFGFDISGIDWTACQMLLISVDVPENSITRIMPWVCNLNQNTVNGHGSGSSSNFLRFGPASFLIALLPFRQPQQNVLGIVIGDPAGVGFGECTYAELTSLDFASSTPYPANTKATLWCVG